MERMTGVALGSGGQLREMQGATPALTRLGQQNGNLNRVISMLSARLDAIGDEIDRLNQSL